MTVTPRTTRAGARLDSLDVCRGVLLVVSVSVNAWFTAPEWFEHAPWIGVHPVDLVFPSFVAASGAGMAIAFARRMPVARQVRRIVVLTLAGLAYNAAAQGLSTGGVDVTTWRVTGVLQLYAVLVLALGLGAGIVRRWWHWLAAAGMVSVLQTAVLVVGAHSCPGGALTTACNPSGVVDAAVFGAHMYAGGRLGHDPEGLVAAAGALVTALVGAAAGRLMWEHRRGTTTAAFGRSVLLLAAATLVATRASGLLVDPFKRLWTAPFGWGVGGVVAVALLLAHLALDGRSPALAERAVRYPLVALGRNSLLVYFGSHLATMVATHTGPAGGVPVDGASWAQVWQADTGRLVGAPGAAWPLCVVAVLAWTTLAVVLHRRGWYLRA